MKFFYMQQSIIKFGKGIPAKIIGWFLITMGVLLFTINTYELLKWNNIKENYTKQYIYNENGILQYEIDNKTIYVETILNSKEEKIEISFPENNTIIMYCHNDENTKCIYLDLNNSIDESKLNPFPNIFVILFFLTFGSYLILTVKYKGTNSKPLMRIFLFFFALGISTFSYGLYLTINHMTLKFQNNLTQATIYSEIYTGKDESYTPEKKQTYKPVAYYYVEGKRYIYINELFVRGNLEKNIDRKIEIYYDSLNPNKSTKKQNDKNICLILIGLFLSAFGSGIFMKKRIDNNIKKIINNL